MRFVLFSDLHLDAPFHWAPLPLGRKLRLALRETLNRICQLALEAGVDALLCAGDLYEQQNFTPDTAEYLKLTFANLAPTKVLIAPGNHDWYGPDSLYNRVAWSENVYIFRDSMLSALRLSDKLTLWGAAHRAPANTEDFFRGMHVNTEGWNVALVHASERGFLAQQEEGKAPHAPFREAEIPEAGFRHAFVGHFHAPKDTEWLTYAGSPQPLAFGEGSGGAVVVEINNGGLHRERVAVSSMAFNTIDVDVSRATSMTEVLERVRTAVADAHGICRVTLHGNLAPSVDLRLDDVRDIPNASEGLVVQAKDLFPDYDLQTIAQEQTVRGQFVRDVQLSALAEPEKQRVLVVGLRALDGRRDLEPL